MFHRIENVNYKSCGKKDNVKLGLTSNPIIYWKDKLCDNKRTDGTIPREWKSSKIISWMVGCGEGLGVVNVGLGGG